MNRREAIKNTALLGVSASFLPLLQACQQQPRLGWQPLFLTTAHAQLVSSLVDTILPATDTPGGLDVKVDMFIDMVYEKTVDEAGQQEIIAGLDAFNATCVDQFGSAFHQLTDEQKASILQAKETKAPTFTGSVWGTAVGEQEPVGFYRSLKSLMLWAYFSSEENRKECLELRPRTRRVQGMYPVIGSGKSLDSLTIKTENV